MKHAEGLRRCYVGESSEKHEEEKSNPPNVLMHGDFSLSDGCPAQGRIITRLPDLNYSKSLKSPCCYQAFT
jgi:hypothetical protein